MRRIQEAQDSKEKMKEVQEIKKFKEEILMESEKNH